ncbi:HEPN family nuclease [Microvirga massiliensis]|uniref:HEPN family nuclease n=1 Tax=Microvirga massiliensis TaxID=1033741 RepID=UPI00062B6737|nr:HEPN family nuclease [Microvirga massiliensis]
MRNIEIIEEVEKRSPDRVSPEGFADTQLLISLLGVLVFPHEKASEFLGHLTSRYPKIEDIVTVQFFRLKGRRFHRSDPDWDESYVRNFPVRELPHYLRNGIAHFNVLPIANGKLFGGVRVWNRNPEGLITFVGDVAFERFRPFAKYVLQGLSSDDAPYRIENPEDPLDELAREEAPADIRPPRLNRDHWVEWLEIHGNDAQSAKTALDRHMVAEIRRRRSAC